MDQPDIADPLIGTSVGSYVVQRKLGEGGMGAVYELLHPGIGKRLALKLLHAEYAARPQIVQRFFDEARAVNLIQHPNIVDIIDFATLPDGRAYINMEFLPGDSLSGYIHKEGALPIDEVARIGKSICSALAAAHKAGIVHRDLKPENIHLVPRPDNPRYVKVLDFGIAKLSADLHADPSSATRSGVVMGTPTYMSPEQAMGRTKEIDHRTDVYALGIILYEMITGDVPFQAESFGDLMLKHLQATPEPLHHSRPDVPEPWNGVVQKALAKDRDHRFQSMEEMGAALDDAAAGRAVAGPTAATVAISPGTRSTGSTMAYSESGSIPGASYVPGTNPPPGTYPPPGSYPPPGTNPPPGTYPPPGSNAPPGTYPPPGSGSKKAVVFAVAGLLAAVAAVVVFLMSRGGDTGPERAAPVVAVTFDAGVRARDVAKAPPPDARAAVVKKTPPDAGVIARVTPPDAAVVKKGNTSGRPPRKKRGKGKLKVNVLPWADVYVDGKHIGATPRTVTLSAGRHRIELRNDEADKRWKSKVMIRAGKTTAVSKNWRQ